MRYKGIINKQIHKIMSEHGASAIYDQKSPMKSPSLDNDIEITIVTAGNVDAGKSSVTGVLIYGELDDGNGSARSKILRHKHEAARGATSDIAVRTLNIGPKHHINLVDLCGHEKYLKTTTYGITGYFPDYALVVIAANDGIEMMTKEHLGILLYMRIPIIVVFTRIDIAITNGGEIYKTSQKLLKKMLGKYGRKVIQINGGDNTTNDEERATREVQGYAEVMSTDPNIVPVITVSNKTGYYIPVLRTLLSTLRPRKLWEKPDYSIFYIDAAFNPPGIGLVVSGVLKGKSIYKGDELRLGPYAGKFIHVKVWGLHNNNREKVDVLHDHTRGCLAIRVLDKKIEFGRNNITKGMIVTNSEKVMASLCYSFEADIEVLKHATTIRSGYMSMLHCGTVRQTVKLIINDIADTNPPDEPVSDKGIDKKALRTGDQARVKFRFVQRPEMIEVGSIFFFREKNTRGTGRVVRTIPLHEDSEEPIVAVKSKHRKNKTKIITTL